MKVLSTEHTYRITSNGSGSVLSFLGHMPLTYPRGNTLLVGDVRDHFSRAHAMIVPTYPLNKPDSQFNRWLWFIYHLPVGKLTAGWLGTELSVWFGVGWGFLFSFCVLFFIKGCTGHFLTSVQALKCGPDPQTLFVLLLLDQLEVFYFFPPFLCWKMCC